MTSDPGHLFLTCFSIVTQSSIKTAVDGFTLSCIDIRVSTRHPVNTLHCTLRRHWHSLWLLLWLCPLWSLSWLGLWVQWDIGSSSRVHNQPEQQSCAKTNTTVAPPANHDSQVGYHLPLRGKRDFLNVPVKKTHLLCSGADLPGEVNLRQLLT